MSIFVSGSLAFDRIMTFPGRFEEHILPDKIHILNVCFLVDGLQERFGGTAGNIAYNLKLLGQDAMILATLGRDGNPYRQRLSALGMSVDGITTIEDEFTAGAYITTDASDNQIIGFNPGAMKHGCGIDPETDAQSLGIISPGNLDDMFRYPAYYRERGVPFFFDPGQQIPAMTGEQMKEAMTGAKAFIANDYELEMTLKATGLTEDGMLELTECLVTTLGEHGCRIRTRETEISVGAVKVDAVADPTGAGDSFRAGLLFGLSRGDSWEQAAQLGAAVASFCVAEAGTQEHRFDLPAVEALVASTFGN